jgi:CDP-6-deoxy-D-xylo-4-hexulose-3-dehydrase
MVVCQSLEDYDLLKSLRAHGWTRELSNRSEIENQYPGLDPRFLFVNVGYNLRPMEIQAALGLKQLERLPGMNINRVRNNDSIIKALKAHPRWDNQFSFTSPGVGVEPVWFGICLQLNIKFSDKKKEFLDCLSDLGVENRPIVSGNFARQPAFKLFKVEINASILHGAEIVHGCGFFVGVHTDALSSQEINNLVDRLYTALDKVNL